MHQHTTKTQRTPSPKLLPVVLATALFSTLTTFAVAKTSSTTLEIASPTGLHKVTSKHKDLYNHVSQFNRDGSLIGFYVQKNVIDQAMKGKRVEMGEYCMANQNLLAQKFNIGFDTIKAQHKKLITSKQKEFKAALKKMFSSDKKQLEKALNLKNSNKVDVAIKLSHNHIFPIHSESKKHLSFSSANKIQINNTSKVVVATTTMASHKGALLILNCYNDKKNIKKTQVMNKNWLKNIQKNKK